MSTAVHSRVGEYSNSVSRFQAAAAGLYSGPSMPVSLLGEMVSQTDGINTQELFLAAGKAAGKLRGTDKGEGFSQFLKEFFIEVGAGLVVDFLTSVQDLHDQDADGREKLVEDTNRCALAIDDTVHVTGVAIVEILAVACRVLELLAGLLMRRGNSIVDAIAPALAEIGDRIIESTNSQVAQTCRDRDDTIERCYQELEKRCEGAIQTPIPQAPEVLEKGEKVMPAACPEATTKPEAPDCPVTTTKPEASGCPETIASSTKTAGNSTIQPDSVGTAIKPESTQNKTSLTLPQPVSTSVQTAVTVPVGTSELSSQPVGTVPCSSNLTTSPVQVSLPPATTPILSELSVPTTTHLRLRGQQLQPTQMH